MGYKVRRASNGGDRRHNRSLAETLAYGNERYGDEGWTGPNGVYSHENESYDEAVGPPDLVRRPHSEEWGPSAEGTRVFESDEHMGDVMGKSTGKGKTKHTMWDTDPMTKYERYYDEEQRDADEALGWGFK